MHLKGGSYYHVTFAGGKRQWKAIGKTYAEAIVEYGKREAATFRRGEMFADLADEYCLRILPSHRAKTQKEWLRMIGKLKQALAGVRAKDLEPHHIATMRDGLLHRPGIANRTITILKVIYRYGMDWGYVTSNPAAATIRPKKGERDRYVTDAEFHAIRSAAPPSVRAAMDISYLTGLRVGDVLALTWRDVTEDGLVVRQQKNEVRGRYPLNADLRAALDRAKKEGRKVGSIYVIARRDGKPYSYYGFRSIYDRACERAKVTATTFHDLRAKAITDAKNAGREPKDFSLHKEKAQADAYVRSRNVPTVEPLTMPIVEQTLFVAKPR